MNASALELVGIAPVLWVVLELFAGASAVPARARRRRPASACCASAFRCGGSWPAHAGRVRLAGARPHRDPARRSRASSTPTDLLRGLGNWFFYGKDRLGRRSSRPATTPPAASSRSASFAVPVARARRRGRRCAGATARTSCCSWWWAPSSASGRGRSTTRARSGRVFREFADGTAAGLVAAQHAARRAGARARPRRSPRGRAWVRSHRSGGSSAAPRSWRCSCWSRSARCGASGTSREDLERDEDVPAYWEAAARAIDAGGDDDARARDPRIELLGVPVGEHHRTDHAGTRRPPLRRARGAPRRHPGLGRPARRARPPDAGGHVRARRARADRAPDGRRHRRAALRSRVRALRHAAAAAALGAAHRPAPPGLGAPRRFGEPVPNRAVARAPLLDPLELRIADDAADPPPVALFPVDDAVPIVRTAPVDQPVLLAGDGDGIVDAAAAGLIDGNQLVLESAALDRRDSSATRSAAGADVVLTDSNRRRSQTYFDRIRDSVGATEPTGSARRRVPARDLPRHRRRRAHGGRGARRSRGGIGVRHRRRSACERVRRRSATRPG